MTALVTRDLCVPSPASVENAVKGDEKWELQFYSLGIIALTLSQSFSPLVCRLHLTTASRRATGQVLLPASWPAGCCKTAGILMPICREIRREEDTVCLSCLFLLLALWMTYGKMSHQIPICRTTLAQILYNLKPEWTFWRDRCHKQDDHAVPNCVPRTFLQCTEQTCFFAVPTKALSTVQRFSFFSCFPYFKFLQRQLGPLLFFIVLVFLATGPGKVFVSSYPLPWYVCFLSFLSSMFFFYCCCCYS